jgi:hypothetical protein
MQQKCLNCKKWSKLLAPATSLIFRLPTASHVRFHHATNRNILSLRKSEAASSAWHCAFKDMTMLDGQDAATLGQKLFISCKIGDFPDVMNILDSIDQSEDEFWVCTIPCTRTAMKIDFVGTRCRTRHKFSYACISNSPCHKTLSSIGFCSIFQSGSLYFPCSLALMQDFAI